MLAQKIIKTTKSSKSVMYSTLIIFILTLYVDKLKWRIKSEWAAACFGSRIIERTVGEWRQSPPLAFMLE